MIMLYDCVCPQGIVDIVVKREGLIPLEEVELELSDL
jgi:hypothetical protein